MRTNKLPNQNRPNLPATAQKRKATGGLATVPVTPVRNEDGSTTWKKTERTMRFRHFSEDPSFVQKISTATDTQQIVARVRHFVPGAKRLKTDSAYLVFVAPNGFLHWIKGPGLRVPGPRILKKILAENADKIPQPQPVAEPVKTQPQPQPVKTQPRKMAQPKPQPVIVPATPVAEPVVVSQPQPIVEPVAATPVVPQPQPSAQPVAATVDANALLAFFTQQNAMLAKLLG